MNPDVEFRWEDLYGSDIPYEFTYDDETDPFEDRNIADAEDSILEDGFLFEN